MANWTRYLGGIGLLAVLSLSSGSTAALAQAGGDFPQQPVQRSTRFTSELGLSPQQKQQILQIQRQYQASGNRQEMWRQIRGVLRPDQLQRLRQLRQGGKGRRPGLRRRNPG